MGSFDGLFERAKQNYPESFAGQSGGSQTVPIAHGTVQQTVDFTGLAERARKNYPEAFSSPKTSGNYLQNQWLKKYQGKGYNSLASSLLELEDGDEKDWLKSYAQKVDYDEKLALDLGAYEKEIQALERQLEDYYPDIDWTSTTDRKKFDADIEAMQADIDKRKNYLTLAKRVQEQAANEKKYSQVTKNADFAEKSGFDSGNKEIGYQYMNADAAGRLDLEQKYGQYVKQFADHAYDSLNAEEKAIYNYLMNTGDRKGAAEYLKYIEQTAQERKGTAADAYIDKLVEEDPRAKIARYAYMANVGLDQHKTSMQDLGHMLSGNEEYVSPSATQYAGAKVREDLASDGKKLPDWMGGGSTGQMVGDIISTTANMAPSILASTVVGLLNPSAGAAVGKGMMSGGAAGSGYRELINEGYTKEQARLYGLGLGAAEYFMESALGGISKLGGAPAKALAKWADNVDNSILKLALRLGGSGGSEGLEEGLQEVISGWLKSKITHEDFYAEPADVMYSSLLGMATGVLFESPDAIADSFSEKNDSTPEATADKPAAVGDKKTPTESISKMENIQQTDDLDSFAQQFGQQADSVRDNYVEGQDLQEYEAGFQVAYALGMEGGNVETLKKSVPYLNQSQREAAYNLGRAAADNVNTGVDNTNASVDNVNGSVDNTSAVTTNEDTASVAEVAAIDTDDVTAAETGIVGSAVQISTGKNVEVARISSISKDGSMTLELSDGTTVDAGDIQHRSEGEAVLYEAVAAIGADAEVSNILVNNWKNDPGGVSAEQYTAGMIDAFNYGRYHVPQKEMSDNKSIQALTPVQRNSAYALGKSFGGQLVQTQEANARRAKAIAKAQSVIKASAQKKQDSTSKKKTTAKTTPASRVNFDRKGKKLNPVQESSLQVMEMLAQATGTKFHVYESYVKNGKRVYKDASGKEKAAPSGWYEDGTGEIHIDLNAGLTADGTMLYTTAHELTHFIREWSPAKFDTLAEVLFEQVYKEKDISVIGLIREQQAKALRTGREISFDEAYEEVVADSMESILTSGNVVDLMAQVKQRDQTLWEKIREWFKNLAEDIRKLVQAYSGHKPDSPEGRAVASMKDMLPILEGFYADALDTASANFQAAESRERVEQTGGRKYSYAGENARTADLDQLATAKAMQQEGVSNETIRQQTGWFMGRDGKWRFEIDDSNMRVDQHGDARGAVSYKWALEDLESARDELWGHADMETLNNVRAYNRAILSGDTAEENRLHDLLINGTHAHNFSLYAEAREHVKEMSQKFGGVLHSGGQLADYVQHDALYEAYPQLQAASFRFGWLPDGTRGQYNPDDNSIIISKEIADSPERTIIHEIQHAIQKAEGFASGSSPEYWETRQRSGDSIGVNDQKIDAQMKHAQEILDSLPEDVAAEFRDWYDLNSRDENKGMVLAQELSSGQYGAQFNDYFMTTWTLEDLVKYNYSRGSNDLYRNTAGEIEARDTANRWQAGLDAEGRKNTPPDLGDDKTVFAEGNVRSEQAKPSLKNPDKLDPKTVTREDVWQLLNNVKSGKYGENTYIPVRISTPGIVQERLFAENLPMAMPVKKVQQAFKADSGQVKGKNIRGHGLTVDDLLYVIENLDSPDYLFAQDNDRGVAVIKLPMKFNNTAVIVEFGDNINAPYMNGYDGGKYNLTITAFEVDNGDVGLFMYQMDKGWRKVFDKEKEGDPAKKFQATRPFAIEQDSLETIVTHGINEVNRKFSHRDPLQEKAAQALETENQRLREDVKGLKDLVKLQGKLTGGKIMNPSSIEKAARVLKKNADAKGDTKELAQLLTDFYSYISGSPDLTWEGVKEAAQKAADWLWENRREEVDEYSAEILQDLRTRSISLSDSQKAEAAVTHDTFGNYRKSLFGSVKITKDGMSLDETWHELASLYPGVFNENMNANDMPAALADIVSRLKSSKNMAVAYDQDMLRQALIRDVYDSYWNVSTLHTVADVKQKEINALKGRHAQQMSDLRAKHRDKVAELRKERRDAVAAVREKERQKAETRTRKVLDKYRDNQEKVAANRAERKGKTALRRQIRKTVFELEKLLNRGNKKKNVKDGMNAMVSSSLKLADALFMDEYSNRDMLRNGVGVELTDAEEKAFKEAQDLLQQTENASFLETMTFDSEEAAQDHLKKLEQKLGSKMSALKDVFARERKRLYGTKVSELIGKLAEEYNSLSDAEDGAVRAAKDENVYAHLLQLQKDVKDVTVRDMSLAQLEMVADAYTMVLTTVRNANKMFAKNLKFKRDTLSNMVMGEIGSAVKKISKLVKPGKDLKDSFSWNNLKPVYAFERLGSETLKALYGNIRKGQDIWAVDMQEADTFRREQYRKHGWKKWDPEKLHSFDFESGKVELNLGQIMSLYAYSRREAALDHLLKGGFVFEPGTEITIKDKHGIPHKYIRRDVTAYSLTANELLQVSDTLTTEQKAFVEEMQTYLSNVMGGKGNEISLQMYGIRSFGEEAYFPIRSAGQYMEKAKEKGFMEEQGQINIVNSGFTKATTPHASNPIVLGAFMDVWAKHVNDMSMYHGFVLPMEDFRRVYNYSSPNVEVGNSKSVNAAIENAFGEAATGYIDQLYKDLNGGAVSDNRETIGKKLVGLHKKAAVFASWSVVIQQPSAFVRAFALVDPGHFVGPKVDKQRHKQLWAELKQYAPVAFVKEMGYFDTGMGKSAKDYLQAEEYSGIREKMVALFADGDYRDEVLGKAPALADEYTWCTIWEAVKRETKAKNPGMNVKGTEFLQIAGDRFAEVIDKTQVYDSVLSRSANMRSKSLHMNMLTSFLAEPTTSINMLEDALRKGDRKQMKRTVGAVYGSVLLNSLLVSLVYAARDDDEDETFWEKYLSSVAVEMLDGLNPITYYPFLKDIWSIGQGFDVERSDMSLITDFADAAKKVVGGIQAVTSAEEGEEESAMAQLKDSLWGMVDTIANLTGLPVKNIRRDIEAARNVVDTISTDRAGRMTTKLSLKDAVLAEVMNAIPVAGLLYEKSKRDRLYSAIVAKDKAYVDRLKADYKTDSSYESAVRKALREHDPRIEEMANAYYEGDYDRLEDLSYKIEKEGVFELDTIVAAYKAEKIAQAEERGLLEEETASEETDVTTVFTMDEYYRAIRSGNDKGINTAYDALIEEKKDHEYYLQHEAEDSIASSVTSKVKGEYLDEDISRADAKSILTKYGGKSNAEAETEIKKWEFQMEYHYAWGSRDRCYRSGSISRSQLASAVMDIEDVSWTKAQEYVDFLELEMRNEKVDISATEASSYFEHAKPNGISVDIYLSYRNKTASIQSDKDQNGKTISGSRKNKLLDVIHALPISQAQKDALYLAEGWAESKLNEAPWH